jgi:hypothetical protein
VEADLDVAVLRSLATGRGVSGNALGLSFRLSAADQDALAQLVDRVGLGNETLPRD